MWRNQPTTNSKSDHLTKKLIFVQILQLPIIAFKLKSSKCGNCTYARPNETIWQRNLWLANIPKTHNCMNSECKDCTRARRDDCCKVLVLCGKCVLWSLSISGMPPPHLATNSHILSLVPQAEQSHSRTLLSQLSCSVKLYDQSCFSRP